MRHLVFVRPPHKHVGQTGERRVSELPAGLKLTVQEERAVVGGGGAYRGMRGLIGLDYDAPGSPSPPAAARHLLYQLPGALACAVVGQFQGGVGVQHAHKGDVWIVQPLGNHLRAQKHCRGCGAEAFQQALMGALAARRVGVHAHDVCRAGKKRRQLLLHFFRARSQFAQVGAAADGAAGGHGLFMTAVVARKRRAAFVVAQADGAVRALGGVSALAAQQEVRESTPVEEQDRLLAALAHAGQRLGKRRREHRALAAFELGAQIHHLDMRHESAVGAFG